MTATPYDPDVDPALQRRLDRVIAEINKLTDERDQLVIQAREDGASLREIAAHAGMTHTGVKKLLGRHLTPELQAQMDDELPEEQSDRARVAAERMAARAERYKSPRKVSETVE